MSTCMTFGLDVLQITSWMLPCLYTIYYVVIREEIWRGSTPGSIEAVLSIHHCWCVHAWSKGTVINVKAFDGMLCTPSASFYVDSFNLCIMIIHKTHESWLADARSWLGAFKNLWDGAFKSLWVIHSRIFRWSIQVPIGWYVQGPLGWCVQVLWVIHSEPLGWCVQGPFRWCPITFRMVHASTLGDALKYLVGWCDQEPLGWCDQEPHRMVRSSTS